MCFFYGGVSLELNLPDNLFASPKAAAGEYPTIFSNDDGEVDEKGAGGGSASNSTSSSSAAASSVVPPPLDMSSVKSCYFQPPRYLYPFHLHFVFVLGAF